MTQVHWFECLTNKTLRLSGLAVYVSLGSPLTSVHSTSLTINRFIICPCTNLTLKTYNWFWDLWTNKCTT